MSKIIPNAELGSMGEMSEDRADNNYSAETNVRAYTGAIS